MKPDKSGLIIGRYGCDDPDCDFGGEAKNAAGLSAQHAEANPGHTVWAEQVTSMKWNANE